MTKDELAVIKQRNECRKEIKARMVPKEWFACFRDHTELKHLNADVDADIDALLAEVEALKPFYDRVVSLAPSHPHLVSDLAWVDVSEPLLPPEPEER